MMKKIFSIAFIAVLSLSPLRGEWQNKSFNWEKCDRPHPGIQLAEWKFHSPRLIRVYAMRIDLQTPGLQFHVTPKPAGYGKPMPGEPELIIRTERRTVIHFAKDLLKQGHPLVAAVNTAPWRPWKKPWNHPYADKMGLLVSGGEILLPPDGKRPAFIVMKNGQVKMDCLQHDADTSQILHAVSGFFFVLQNGIPEGESKGLAPRTGFGLSSDHRYLYWFVADGRQKDYSMGMTVLEVGTFLRYLGAHTGINMDGGGSSTLVLLRKNKPVMLNKQPKNGIRTVGAALGISIKK
ncbi:MAG: phosphodiester glycosidase family protein [Lentisphaeria bacterium]|nr:phosphodiester glycosidase family protein [Lentisphaeria bacterium]